MRSSPKRPMFLRTIPVAPGLVLLFCLPTVTLPQSAEYTVAWLGVPVVDVTIENHAGERGDYTEYQARTRAWFDRIYSVDNQYRIWVDETRERPLRYEKQIHERGVRDSLWASYDRNDPSAVIYSNGAERLWPSETQTFFSALLWLQYHDWEPREKRILQVEVEGVLWEVELACLNNTHSDTGAREIVEISADFVERLEGEPVLGTTDVLTYMLPGEDHQLRFALDMEQHLILWAEFGSWPFVVRAELAEGSNQQ